MSHVAASGIPCTFTVDALLFDLDGTLIDSTPATERAWLTWGERMGRKSHAGAGSQLTFFGSSAGSSCCRYTVSEPSSPYSMPSVRSPIEYRSMGLCVRQRRHQGGRLPQAPSARQGGPRPARQRSRACCPAQPGTVRQLVPDPGTGRIASTWPGSTIGCVDRTRALQPSEFLLGA